jgi:hypothetical protein
VRSLAEGQEPETSGFHARGGELLMPNIPHYTGTDSEKSARPELEHYGNCDVCGALVDMRDLAQVMAHMHGRQPIDLPDKPDPDLQ